MKQNIEKLLWPVRLVTKLECDPEFLFVGQTVVYGNRNWAVLEIQENDTLKLGLIMDEKEH